MKKLVLGSAILAVLGMTSTAMAANNGTVNFTGAVSSATCDLKVTNASGAEIPTVDLGTVSTTGTPASVQFKLVPSDNACLAKNGAQISWTSNNLTTQGFSNATTGEQMHIWHYLLLMPKRLVRAHMLNPVKLLLTIK